MLHFPSWKIAAVFSAILIGMLLALPNVLPQSVLNSFPQAIPAKRVHLGLDLRGGSHLLLEVDAKTALQDRMESLRDEVRVALRKNRVGYRALRVEGVSIRARLRNPAQSEKALAALEDISAPFDAGAFAVFSGPPLDMSVTEAGALVITLNEDTVIRQRQIAVNQSIEIVRRRIDETGTTEPTIQRQGVDRILVQVPGFDDPERLKALIGRTAKLNFQLVYEGMSAEEARQRGVPPGAEILESTESEEAPALPYLLRRNVMISGENLVDAQPAFDQITNAPMVTFQLDSLGARRFGDITSRHVGKPFAIVLDGKVVSAPVINEPILGGRAQITGRFSVQEVNDLAILLRAGALPAPMHILEERTVGPALGADSIRAGTNAAWIGLLAVIIFLFLVYGLFGVFANLALLINLTLIAGVLSFLQATLTLPGIAGIVLTVGMAVDANVLIFERIREEAGTGKPPISALDAGYRRALATILDANITTFIAAAILFLVGSGPVRGFAVTLGIGIVTSVFTAFTFTRLLTALWVQARRPQTLPLSPKQPIAPVG